MKSFLLLAAVLAAAPTAAQEIVTIPTRPGVTQSFFVSATGGRQPQAIALMYVGGGGDIELRTEDGKIRFREGNFLPRSRREWIRNGVLPVVLDTPSDVKGDLSDDFRIGQAHGFDGREVVRELQRRYPSLPIFIVGTSRGTISAAHVARSFQGDEIRGVVFTASLFLPPQSKRRVGESLQRFDYGRIKAPILFVHHREDECPYTPASEATKLAARYPVILVSGGKPAEADPCQARSAHGFFGMEAETVDAITAWMLGKPFSKDIR